jgi:hypothetical protein
MDRNKPLTDAEREASRWFLAALGLSELVIPLLILLGRVSIKRGLVGWVMVSFVHAGCLEYVRGREKAS